MKWPKGAPRHVCAPEEFRRTPNFTGSHELDAVIHKNPNPDLKKRMEIYGGYGAQAYAARTGYNGYNPESEDV
jgi:hypothetical protein